MATTPPSLEAKIVLLGSASVGKTSLAHRYVHGAALAPSKTASTIGASFLTHRALEPSSGTTLRLQLWDTAGQERFRSLGRLYYRGADAAVLCYDVTDRASFEALGGWLGELRAGVGDGDGDGGGGGLGGLVVHVVGTKTDLLERDPGRREVPFERCIGFVGEFLLGGAGAGRARSPLLAAGGLASPDSARSSGCWGPEEHEALYTSCHEVSAAHNEGVDEVFRIITQKLVARQQRKAEMERVASEAQLVGGRGRTPGVDGAGGGLGYFDLPGGGNGSFRVGAGGDKRRSWLGFPTTPGGMTGLGDEGEVDVEGSAGMSRGRCC